MPEALSTAPWALYQKFYHPQVSTALLTISGFSLRGYGNAVAEVTLVWRVATILNTTDSQVLVSSPVGPAPLAQGDVVLTADTGAVITATNAFTFNVPGFASAVNPSSERVCSVATVTGNHLCGNGTPVSRVLLAGFEANITSQSCGFVTVVANDVGNNRTSPVTVISNTGAIVTGQPAANWTYISEGNIASETPAAGQSGTTVTIVGQRLLGSASGVASMRIGSISAALQSAKNTEVVATLVTSSTGVVDVVETGTSGVTVRLHNGFTFSAVDSVTPTYGQRGTVVTIAGLALLSGGSNVSEVLLGVDRQLKSLWLWLATARCSPTRLEM